MYFEAWSFATSPSTFTLTGSSGFPPRPCFIFEAVEPGSTGALSTSGGGHTPSTERKRCLLCGKVVSNDYQHYRVHFPGNYPCKICHSLFKRKDYWKTHMRKQHGASFPTASEKAKDKDGGGGGPSSSFVTVKDNVKKERPS